MATLTESALPVSPWQRVRVMCGEIKQRFAIARADARVRAELEYELACLDHAGELDGVLNGLGLSRAAIPMLIKNYPGSARRYLAMTRRLGVGVQSAPSLMAGIDALFGPRRRCLLCPKSRRCETWLRAGGGESYRAFCPNALVFDRMRKTN